MRGNEKETPEELDKRIWVHQTYAGRDMYQCIIDMMDLYVRTVKILDASCGNGTFARKMKEKVLGFGTIHALDISQDLITTAKNTDPQLEINYFVHDANNPLEFKDNEIDFVTCLHAIYYYNNPEQNLKEFKRILKENGILIFTAPGRNNARELLNLIGTVSTGFSEQTIEKKSEDQIIPTAYKIFGNIRMERFINPVIFIKPELLMDYIKTTPYWKELKPYEEELLERIEWWMKTYGNFTITKEVHIVQCQKITEVY